MIAAPGSTLWLLRHELRLLWRGSKGKLPIVIIALFVFFQLIAFGLAAAVRTMPPIPPQYTVPVWAGVSGVLIVALLLMVSSALVT